jgi:hypothetical protein
VKDVSGDLLVDFHNIMNRSKDYFSQLLSVHGVSNVRQIELHSAEPLVLDPSPCISETDTENWKRCKSPCSNQTPAELFIAGGETLRSEIHKRINSV